MPGKSLSVWLMVSGIDRMTFSRSAAFSIAAELGAQFLEHIYVPGLLMAFENAKTATRAALRFHPELVRVSTEGVAPAMIIDAAGDPKRLSTIAHGLPPNTILVTDAIGRHLAVEALEILPGPRVPLEEGGTLLTHLVMATSHNLGWALPVLTMGTAQPYVRRSEPAVVNITMSPRKERIFPRLPWKLVLIMTLTFIAFWSLLAITRNIVRNRRAAQPAAVEEKPINVLEEVGISPSATPIPQGFATVVIQTVPPDSKVFLDDQLVGSKSPVVIPNKSNQQSYKLTVTRKGYETYTSIFNVEAEQKKLLDIRLAKAVPKRW